MPKLNGISYSREDFLRHLGNFSHVAGITPLTFDGGRAVISAEKCVSCGKCAEACKFGVIVSVQA